jgi:hypothetical protein
MSINLLNIVSIIFIALALLTEPLLQIVIQGHIHSFPLQNIPSNISGSVDFLFDLLHLIFTIMLYFTIIILAIYSFLNRKSRFATAVLGVVTSYIIICSLLFAIASSINPSYSFMINYNILFLLIAFMLTKTSDIYAVYLVTPEGNRVPLTLRSLSTMSSNEQEKELKPEKKETEKRSEEGKEKEKKKGEEKKKERKVKERKGSEEKMLSEIAKEILRG